MMTQLQLKLTEKKEALEKLKAIVQETKGAKPPSIATVEANTMTETAMVTSPFLDIPREHLGEFEKHTRGIGSKLSRQIGYDGQRLHKRG